MTGAWASSCGPSGSAAPPPPTSARTRSSSGSTSAGEVEVELVPQGTLAERLRAGGAGIPAFYTPAGVGHPVAEGGLPWRYDADGGDRTGLTSQRRRARSTAASTCWSTRSSGDFALVRAARGDRHGNLVFHASARNFNPLCAMAGRVTIAEVEELVEPGQLDPDAIHLPGVFVQRVVEVGQRGKRIEKRTVR